MYYRSLTLLLLTLSGCAIHSPQAELQSPPVLTNTQVKTDCESLLDDYERFSLLDEESRKQWLEAVRNNLALGQGRCNQLRLALLLSEPDNPSDDQQQSLKLLETLINDEPTLELPARQLAVLVRDQLKQNQSRRRQIVELKSLLERQHASAKQSAKKLANLQSQLEQLKNIEKNINEKEQSIITPPAKDITHEKP